MSGPDVLHACRPDDNVYIGENRIREGNAKSDIRILTSDLKRQCFCTAGKGGRQTGKRRFLPQNPMALIEKTTGLVSTWCPHAKAGRTIISDTRGRIFGRIVVEEGYPVTLIDRRDIRELLRAKKAQRSARRGKPLSVVHVSQHSCVNHGKNIAR